MLVTFAIGFKLKVGVTKCVHVNWLGFHSSAIRCPITAPSEEVVSGILAMC